MGWPRGYSVTRMAVSQPVRIQSLEEMYRLLRTAVVGRRPIAAVYHGRGRLLCPHRLGPNKERQPRLSHYQRRKTTLSRGDSARCAAASMPRGLRAGRDWPVKRVIRPESVNATRLPPGYSLGYPARDVLSHRKCVLLTFSTVESLPYTVEYRP